MINGENAPFRNDDEDETDEAVAGDDGGADRDNGQQKVERDMEKRTECVATFAYENIVSHAEIIAYPGKLCGKWKWWGGRSVL